LLTNDAALLAHMQALGMTHLATNDDDFDKVMGITVWKPRFGTFAAGLALGEEGLRIAAAVAHPGSLMYAFEAEALPRLALDMPSVRQGRDCHRKRFVL
jgi:predicted transcriptional regulator